MYGQRVGLKVGLRDIFPMDPPRGFSPPENGSVMSLFPTLLPENSSFNSYSGFVEIKGEHFQLAIRVPTHDDLKIHTLPPQSDSSLLKSASLYCCARLRSLLIGSEELLRKRLAQSANIAAFLVEFKMAVEQAIVRAQLQQTSSISQNNIPAQYYSRLLTELGEFGWENVTSINQALNQVSLRLLDSAGRIHTLDLVMPNDYPLSMPICHMNLPVKFESKWNHKTSSISDLVNQYQAQLLLYQDLWDILQDIDQNTCVIEPERPSFADLMRRIVVSKHVSVRIELNALNPMGIPVCSFMGAETTLRPLREALASRIQLWDYRKTVRLNLEFMLDLSFPSKQTGSDEDNQQSCAVCYGYRVGDQIPDRICDNPSCSRPYHSSCLFEWLNGLNTSNRAASNVIWGKCPYCDQKISVKNPNFK